MHFHSRHYIASSPSDFRGVKVVTVWQIWLSVGARKNNALFSLCTQRRACWGLPRTNTLWWTWTRSEGKQLRQKHPLHRRWPTSVSIGSELLPILYRPTAKTCFRGPHKYICGFTGIQCFKEVVKKKVWAWNDIEAHSQWTRPEHGQNKVGLNRDITVGAYEWTHYADSWRCCVFAYTNNVNKALIDQVFQR